MIMKTGFSIGKDNFFEITDPTDESIKPQVVEICIYYFIIVKSVDDLKMWDNLVIHKMGSYDIIHVDIGVSPTLTVSGGEQVYIIQLKIAKRVKESIVENIPTVSDVYVHTYTTTYLQHLKNEKDLNYNHRSETDIRSEVKELIDEIPDIDHITHIYIHYMMGI